MTTEPEFSGLAKRKQVKQKDGQESGGTNVQFSTHHLGFT